MNQLKNNIRNSQPTGIYCAPTTICENYFWLSECSSKPDKVPAFKDLPFQRGVMLQKYTDSNTSTR